MKYDPYQDSDKPPRRLNRATDKTGWHPVEHISILDILNLSPEEFRHALEEARDLHASKLRLARARMQEAMTLLEEAEALHKTLFDMATDREEGNK